MDNDVLDEVGFDVHAVRQDFPILDVQVHGKPLVYLDSAATSQKPQAVIDSLVHYYTRYNANVHRGIYTLSEQATAAYENARAKVAAFINAPSPECIVFVRNTTEAINLVRYAWGADNVRADDEVLISEMEHHSNLVPWQLLAREKNAELRFLRVNNEGRLMLDGLDVLITEKTRLIAVTHVSNVLGTINPVKGIIKKAHKYGALVLLDAAQSVPHMPVDVQELDCDFLAFSGHKMMGPTGVGVLYAKPHLLEAMRPFMGGGSMIRKVMLTESTWADVPQKFEAGTPNIADVIALGAAVDYLDNLGMANVREHEIEITQYALDMLREVPGIKLFGPWELQSRAGVVSFVLEGVHPHDIAQILDSEAVAVRAGHHCCQPLMRRFNVPATARASFYAYTTEQEVDALVEGIHKAQRVFGHAVERSL